ncbi:MAG: hypothetical protein AB7K52_03815 [Phycisphaerales bacterium]
MSAHSTPRNRTARLTALQPILLLAISGLAVGCAQHSQNTVDATLQSKASRATVSIDPTQVKGSQTGEWFRQEGSKTALPDQWVAEAQIATAENEAERAAAQSALVRAEANRAEAMARSMADREAAQRDFTIGQSNARKTREVFNAKLSEIETQAVAGQKRYEADDLRSESMLDANVKQWQAEVERMRSRTESDWSKALAEHEEMLSRRAAVEKRGRTTIDQMIRQSDLTEQRAIARVSELRTQSRSISEQTDATVAEINSSIKTEDERTMAEVNDLRQQAASLKIQSTAEVHDLTAEADALEKMDIEQLYNLKMVGAKSEFDRQVADAEQIRLTAGAMKTASIAEIDRRRGDTKKQLEDARTEFTDALNKSETMLQKSKADVTIARAQADRLEREARARFVKAEIEARVAAIREQAKHQSQLAEAEFQKVRSQVDAHAAAIQAQVAKDLADQTAAGSISMPGNDIPQNPGATSGDGVPAVTNANAKPPVIPPDRLAMFKTALAEVAKLRTQSDAAERTAIADSEQRIAGVTSWWKEQVAAHDASMVEIDGLERKMTASFAEMTNNTDSRIAAATAGRTKAEVDAEAFRKETSAKVAVLRAKSDATFKKANARIALLTTQADASERNGKSRLEALTVKRDATLRRGQAMAQQLLTEAESLETGQRAVVAQMREEIRSAESILNSELARLDRAAQTYVEVAKANYDEGVVNANTFERISVANAGELQAQNLAARKTAQASVEFVRDLATSGELLAQAEIARVNADTDHAIAAFNAQDLITRSAIETENRIAEAAAESTFTAADARDRAVLARFDSRITQTESDRNRAYAKVYLDGQQQNTRREQAFARAQAYRELSNMALARLEAAGVSFSRTANFNWDSRLAMPEPLPVVDNSDFLNNKAIKDLRLPNQPQPAKPVKFTNVPTDGE